MDVFVDPDADQLHSNRAPVGTIAHQSRQAC